LGLSGGQSGCFFQFVCGQEWGEYVPDARRDSLYCLLTHIARQHSSTTLLRMAQLHTALYGSTMRLAAQRTTAQQTDLDENLDFLLGDLDCLPILNTAQHSTAHPSAPQHCTTQPSILRRRLP
jgi:hypothetical protein